jgi:DNA-binding response OmpR family regulator
MACFLQLSGMNIPIRILLIEDDSVLGPMTLEGLRYAGHDPLLSPTWASAYGHLIAPHTFRVVLLDLQIGPERGETLFERLIAEEVAYPSIIILSSQPMDQLQQAAVRVRTRHILRKPATLEEINAAIHVAIH